MADAKLSALTAASALDGTELLYGVQSATSKKITGAQVKAYSVTLTSVSAALSLGTGVATFLATPSTSNLTSALTGGVSTSIVIPAVATITVVHGIITAVA